MHTIVRQSDRAHVCLDNGEATHTVVSRRINEVENGRIRTAPRQVMIATSFKFGVQPEQKYKVSIIGSPDS